jgi:hypothetical protein
VADEHVAWNTLRDVRALGPALREIEHLRAAIDSLLSEIDTDHQPEPVPGDGPGREPLLCRTCGAGDGSWPCTHRMALDDLKAARHPTSPR